MRAVTAVPWVRRLLGSWLRPRDPRLQIQALGLTFPGPVGVAGGMDKRVRWFDSLGVLGFGFVEVGTVTAEPQAGNEKPRVFRLTEDRGLLNSMGFPNPGADVAEKRLRAKHGDTIIAANIGKSKITPLDRAGEDYRKTTAALAPQVDLLVLNVSSPNTPGLRDMQAVEPLRILVADVRSQLRELDLSIPILVKLSPDLSDERLDAIADLAVELELDGLVATNTTTSRDGLRSDPAVLTNPGGVSGAPLKARSFEVLERLYARVQDRLVLISVGGIETPDDVWERILAGATLVQGHTGFVYGGPLWAHHLNQGLLELMDDAGWSSLQDAIGSSHRLRAGGPQANGHGSVFQGDRVEVEQRGAPTDRALVR
jgi:dihydroorotate dehydrogenase